MQVASNHISGDALGGFYSTQDNKGGGWYGANHMPIPVAEAATRCICSSDGCTIIWKYQ